MVQIVGMLASMREACAKPLYGLGPTPVPRRRRRPSPQPSPPKERGSEGGASQKPLRATTPAKQDGKLDPEGDAATAGAFPRNRDLGELVTAASDASAQLEVSAARGQPRWSLHVVRVQDPRPRRRGQSNRTGSGCLPQGSVRDQVPDVGSQERGRPGVPQLGQQLPPPGWDGSTRVQHQHLLGGVCDSLISTTRPLVQRLTPRSPSQLREPRCHSAFWPRNLAGLNGVCWCHT